MFWRRGNSCGSSSSSCCCESQLPSIGSTKVAHSGAAADAEPGVPGKPAPPQSGRLAVFSVLSLNATVFVLWQLQRRGGSQRLLRVLDAHALCSMAHLRRGRVHTLFTSTVSHQRAAHFAMNAYGIGLFGCVAAETLSGRELGILLGVCGASSSACHVMCHPRSPVLGASGALMGLIAVDALLQPEHRFYMVLPVPGLTLSMLQVADLALAANLLGFLVLRQRLGAVAWAAHLGGTAAGLGYACGALWNGDCRFGHPVRLHAELCASDWFKTADSMEVGLDWAASAVERWRGRV